MKIIDNAMFKYYWLDHKIGFRLQNGRKPPMIVADAINRHLLARFDFYYRNTISFMHKFLEVCMVTN